MSKEPAIRPQTGKDTLSPSSAIVAGSSPTLLIAPDVAADETSAASLPSGIGQPDGSSFPPGETGAIFNWYLAYDEGEREFRALYPLTSAALDRWQKTSPSEAPVLSVRSARDGFRRGGISHQKLEQRHDLLDLAPAAIEAILGEPELVARIL